MGRIEVNAIAFVLSGHSQCWAAPKDADRAMSSFQKEVILNGEGAGEHHESS